MKVPSGSGTTPWPKTNWPEILCLVWWYICCTAKAAAVSIPIQGSESSTYASCRLYVHTRLPNTWCIFSMVAFTCGLLGEAGLVLIPYYFSIKLLLNSWLRKSPHAVILDFYWPWILEHKLIFYQVWNRYYFIVIIFC